MTTTDPIATARPSRPRRSGRRSLRPVRPLVFLVAALCTGTLLGTAAFAGHELVTWEEIETGQLLSTYIEVDRPIELEISALATFDKETWRPIAYPWILDAATRKVRWTVDPDNPSTTLSRRGRATRARVKADTLHLAPGQYEIYFATFGDRYQDLAFGKLGGYLDNWLKSRKLEVRDDWQLRISTATDDHDGIVVGHRAKPEFDSLARIPHPGDSVYEYELFSVDRPVEILVYAVGEYDRDGRQFVDSGWIADAETRQPIWEMTRRNTKPAGGAAKNRRFRGFVELEPGTYMVGYSSDDSHSFGDWNLNPPHDPDFWGIALFDPRGDVGAHFVTPVEDPFKTTVVVDINRRRNSTYSTQGLKVLAPIDVFVMSLGEFDHDGTRFVDFGWIETARSGEHVWEMTRHNTRPAGGAEKNRMADESIRLGKGDYVIGYATDDSHAYRQWNAAPPRYPDRWGIQISALGKEFDRESIRLFDADENTHMLVDLITLGDKNTKSRYFTLEEPTIVRIVSVGEGLHGHMFDYGRLRKTSDGGHQSRMVWKMSYEETEHAGGADKNRIADVTLELAAGRYEAEYVSDDSHSFGGWNASPPDRPHLWGIRVYRVER